ncbi:fluoride efflux transporter FluC [Georgenia sp. Z1344]|uniref:fluoride efflux transporter FluC n=1 Tax=Georgenia sp. Z1344 TaxID=3416706 RepID=UPI003CE6D347
MSPLTWLLVSVAGGLGAGSRFMLDGALTTALRPSVPVGTVVVNLIGSLLLGVVVGVGAGGSGGGSGWSPELTTVAGTGFLGGFTTFSTASVDIVRMLSARRPVTGAVVCLGMLVGGVAAAWCGWELAR